MIVVLNGAPRSGKSTIARAVQELLEGTWVNLGVDTSRATTPPALQPGIGLRPGETAHPAAAFVPLLYAALWESVAAHARLGLDVVVDVGMYDPEIAADAARRLDGLPTLFVGVRCPLDVVMERRRQSDPGQYAVEITPPIVRWQDEVHAHWTYDVEVDTSELAPAECVAAIVGRLAGGSPPSAFARLATFRA